MNIFDTFDIVYFIFLSFVFVPIGVAIYRWRYLTTLDKIVFYFLIGYLFLTIIAAILLFSQIRNHFLYYFHTILTALFMYFYGVKIHIFKTKKAHTILSFCCVSIFLGLLLEMGFIGFNQINTVTLTFSKVVMFVLSILFLKNEVKDYKLDLLDLNSVICYNIGLFMFSFFSIFTSLFKNYFIETSINLYFFFDTISVLSNAIAFCFFAFGFGITKN